MAKGALTINLHIDGVRETLDAFKQLPKEANDAMKDRAKPLAEQLASRAQSAARREGSQAALMARTVKVRRDRLPVIIAGGSKRVGRNRAPAWGLLFGSEFGMSGRSGWYGRPRYRGSAGRQYREHGGNRGYWFFPTVEKNASDIAQAWSKAADDVINEFTQGGA